MTRLENLYFGSFIGGNEVNKQGKEEIEVINPYTTEVIGRIASSSIEEIEQAVESANRVFHKTMKQMPAHERSAILRKTADLLEADAETFARLLSLEAGKPIRESRGEVTRAVQVLRFSSEGAKSIYGEQIPMDSAMGGESQIGLTKRVPVGVIAAITPFNFPLNLVLHKVAPAIAAGNTVVLKPAEKTPFSAVFIYRLFDQAGLPKGALNLLMGRGEDIVESLVTHPKVKKVTFTGSNVVGWKIDAMAKRKRVTLELGSNAPNIIFADCNLEKAIQAMKIGAFTYAGQACVAAQRVYVEQSIYDDFIEKFVLQVKELQTGDPFDESTDMGPMITEEAAIKAESWIKESVNEGAKILIGGERNGTLLEPTIIVDVNPDMKVVCAEVFAPIVCIIPFTSEDEVIAAANDTDFGLHAGVFTTDINRAMRLADALEMGGVWINEVSVRRHDHIPYGGVKSSGIGREGVKYSIQEMTDIKFIGLNLY